MFNTLNKPNESLCSPIILILVVIIVLLILSHFSWNTNTKTIVIEPDKGMEHMSPGTLTQMFAQDAQDTYLKGDVDQLATGNFVLQWGQPTRIATGPAFYSTDPNRGWIVKQNKDCTINGKRRCRARNGCVCKNGIGYYPRSYPGNAYLPPQPDINFPLPYIVNAAAFTREGFDNQNDILDQEIENFDHQNNFQEKQEDHEEQVENFQEEQEEQEDQEEQEEQEEQVENFQEEQEEQEEQEGQEGQEEQIENFQEEQE